MKYFERFEDYLTPTQDKLFAKLCEKYEGKGGAMKNEFILVRGEAPVMLVAHLDTVHKEPVKNVCISQDGNIWMSPQGIGGDDRCGVYALNTIYERAKVKPWLLFTCNEEIGGIGAKSFCTAHGKGELPDGLDELKCLIEIDRKGKNDAVYYECDNEEFEDYITGKGFITDWGTFTDISLIAPELGVAAVNLSSGYYNAHTQYEYINRKELDATIDRVLEIVDDAAKPDFPCYEYIEADYSASWYGTGYYDWGKYYPSAVSKQHDSGFEYQREYDALLEFHTSKELDKIREELGDAWIEYLFESEFGGSFDEVFGDEEEEEI